MVDCWSPSYCSVFITAALETAKRLIIVVYDRRFLRHINRLTLPDVYRLTYRPLDRASQFFEACSFLECPKQLLNITLPKIREESDLAWNAAERRLQKLSWSPLSVIGYHRFEKRC